MANSGGIRAPFEEGNITQADLLATFPFQNTFDLITIAGKYIREAFENSVSHMTRYGEDGEGRFLQASGFKVVYDVRKPVGQRVTSLKVVCENCKEGYVDLQDSQQYNVVTSNFMASGGDNYGMITENLIKQTIGALDTDVMRSELEHHSPVTAALGGRIVIKADQSSSDGVASVAAGVSLLFVS